MAEVHDMNLGFEYSDLTEDFSSPLFPGLLLEPDLDDPWPEELQAVGGQAGYRRSDHRTIFGR